MVGTSLDRGFPKNRKSVNGAWIPFFDGFINTYGNPIETYLEKNTNQHCQGKLKLGNAPVTFKLSNSFNREEQKNKLLIEINEQLIDLNKSDKELFIIAYKNIINNNGIEISEIKPTIRFLERL